MFSSPRAVLTFLLVVVAGAAARAEDATGTIKGRAEAPDRVAAVVAVDRSSGKQYPGVVDPASGEFTVAGLPLGAAFDCRIDYRGGPRLEGVSLKVPVPEDEDEAPLSAEDVEAIKAKMQQLNKFEDEIRLLTVTGNTRYAAVLANKLRTRPFVNSKPGEVVWRCEVWRFERPDETWIMAQDELSLVLYRERLPRADYAKKSVTFDPALGGLAVTKGVPTVRLGPSKRPPETPGVRLRSPTKEPGGLDQGGLNPSARPAARLAVLPRENL